MQLQILAQSLKYSLISVPDGYETDWSYFWQINLSSIHLHFRSSLAGFISNKVAYSMKINTKCNP